VHWFLTRYTLSSTTRTGEGETEVKAEEVKRTVIPPPPVKQDPFGFGSGSPEPPDGKMVPGFDTAEGRAWQQGLHSSTSQLNLSRV
jgi:hypothetical protein